MPVSAALFYQPKPNHDRTCAASRPQLRRLLRKARRA
jgi:hypothetical protein